MIDGLHRRSVGDWGRHLGGHRPPDALRRDLSNSSIPNAAHALARRFPGREALRIGGASLTHGQLDDASRRLAGWLAEQGAGPGTRVVLATGTSLGYVVGYLAVLHTGATVVAVNPVLTPKELGDLVDESDPVAAVADEERAENLGALGVRCLLCLEGSVVTGLPAVVTSLTPLPPTSLAPDTVAQLAFTSGTTGRPKPTPLTHANLVASASSVLRAWRFTEDDTVVHALPLQHGHGLSGLLAVILTGCRGVFLPAFDPDALAHTIDTEQASVLFGVPTIYERMLGSGAWEHHGPLGLRLATCGSAPLSPALGAAVSDLVGIRLLERYGATEVGFVLSNPYDGERRLGTVGFALPGAEVAIVDERGDEVPDGTVGEVVCRGPSVFGGYSGGADPHRTAWFGDWFRTGDLAVVDPADGYVSIVGRSKELIITGGLNVYPREVELALEALPQVAEAAVVGVPSARWGEEVRAFVVPAPGTTLDPHVLDEALAKVLAPYKRPKAYQTLEHLPRNALGKVLRQALTTGRGGGSGAAGGPSGEATTWYTK
jgi:malonyl-CoA/methylmalonyl-CoA synthetase